jgi:hypothetical protein
MHWPRFGGRSAAATPGSIAATSPALTTPIISSFFILLIPHHGHRPAGCGERRGLPVSSREEGVREMNKPLLAGLTAGLIAAAALQGTALAAGPRDTVSGTATFDIDDSRATVNARSDADGSDALGRYSIVVDDPDPVFTTDPTLSFSADVVCLAVDGDEAVVGAVVTASSDTDAIPLDTGLLHDIVDNGPPGIADASITALFAPASDCADYLPWPSFLPPEPVQTGNWVVRDR